MSFIIFGTGNGFNKVFQCFRILLCPIFIDTLGGEVGLAISACMSLTGGLQYGMRQSAEVENQMTSVERVAEYGRLESEAGLTKPTLQEGLTTKDKQGEIIC
jgi:hypothetical protein